MPVSGTGDAFVNHEDLVGIQIVSQSAVDVATGDMGCSIRDSPGIGQGIGDLGVSLLLQAQGDGKSEQDGLRGF